MKRWKRWLQRRLQLVTGVHKVHHVRWSYGWAMPFIQAAWFPMYGWRRVERRDYHDCTTMGVR